MKSKKYNSRIEIVKCADGKYEWMYYRAGQHLASSTSACVFEKKSHCKQSAIRFAKLLSLSVDFCVKINDPEERISTTKMLNQYIVLGKLNLHTVDHKLLKEAKRRIEQNLNNMDDDDKDNKCLIITEYIA